MRAHWVWKPIALGCLLLFWGVSLIASEDAAHWIDVMSEGSIEERKAAREALIALEAEAVPALIEMCEDPDELLRWEAVNALGAIAQVDPDAAAEAIPALVARASTDHGGHPRWRSLWALTCFPDDVIATDIVPRLYLGLEDPEDQARWYATVALAFFRQPDVAPLLNQGIDREAWFDRWEAIYCLRFVHDENSIVLLIAVFSDAENPEDRSRVDAIMTLSKIKDPTAIPALTGALTDPLPQIRWTAAQALAAIAGISVLSELEAALTRETDPFARERMEGIIDDLHSST